MRINILLLEKILLFSFLILFTSCNGQEKTYTPKAPNTSNQSPTVIKNFKAVKAPDFDTKYEYTDAIGKKIIIQNSFPRGGQKYTDPKGKSYVCAVFWTQIINETDNPFEWKIDFPLDSYDLPSSPGRYFKILLPSDTMTLDKEILCGNINAITIDIK